MNNSNLLPPINTESTRSFEINHINPVIQVPEENNPLSTSEFLKAISDEAEQLHAKIDPLVQFREEFREIIHYKSSSKNLYMNNGKLDYYQPKSIIGPYSSGIEVAKYFKSRIAAIKNFYNLQPKKHKWRVLKICNSIINGFNEIVKDYNKASYQSFRGEIYTIIQDLETFILTKNEELNTDFEEHHQNNKNKIYDIFQLIEFYAADYPKEVVTTSLSKYYGERLTHFVLNRFMPKQYSTISFNELYQLIFTIATCVQPIDLMWKYKQEEPFGPNFDSLSDLEYKNLLHHFRTSTQGMNLLDYFAIKIELHKFTVDETYLSTYPPESTEEEARINEILVYADMESSKIWHPRQVILMSDVQRYDQLCTLFNDPFNPTLFHPDKYFSFLNVAATCIATLQSCKGNLEAIRMNMNPIINLLEKIHKKCHKIYPPQCYTLYQNHWTTLLGRLKKSLTTPDINLTSYYLSLFTHPFRSKQERLEALDHRAKRQPDEFLSRKVAYWNRYYLESKSFTNKQGELLDKGQLNHRKGSLFLLSNGKKMEVYQIAELIWKEGLLCQIAIPLHFKKIAEEKKAIPLKVIFQGTIDNPLYYQHNKNIPGPGEDIWIRQQTGLVIPEIKKQMALIRSDYLDGYQPTFSVTTVGHSLGGAWTQLFLSYLFSAFELNELSPDWIKYISGHTFNTAGISTNTKERFNGLSSLYPQKNKLYTHSIEKNDLVPLSGQCKIGVDFFKPEIIIFFMQINSHPHNVMKNHCDYLFSWTDNILPMYLLKPKRDQETINKYFSGIGLGWRHLVWHAKHLIDQHPITKTAFTALSIVSLVFGNYFLILAGESALLMGGAAFKIITSTLTETSNSYAKQEITSSASSLYNLAIANWKSFQLLEDSIDYRNNNLAICYQECDK